MSTNKKLRTRTRYRIVGSDYSAQEPRMSCFLSSDEKMLEAYTHGKDLYAMIASSALGVKYDECLEFWPEFCAVEIDGKEVISGSGKELDVKISNSEIILPACYLITLSSGEEVAIENLIVGNKINSDLGELTIIKKEFAENTIINNKTVKNIKLTFIQ